MWPGLGIAVVLAFFVMWALIALLFVRAGRQRIVSGRARRWAAGSTDSTYHDPGVS